MTSSPPAAPNVAPLDRLSLFGSLRARLVIAASIVVAIVIGLQSYFEIRVFEARAEADLREAGALTAQAVSDDLELRGGLPALPEITNSLHEFINTVPTIRAVSVVALDEDARPKVVASTSSDERDEAIALAADVIRGRPPEWRDLQGSLTSFAMPVMRGDTREAAVVVTMSRAAVDELRTRGRLVTLWLAPLAIIVLTILIDQVAREFIYRPLAGIHLTMRRTGAGETGARAPVLRQDELGAVALGLNQMLERIEGFSAALQERVDEATTELRTSNAERIENYQRVLALREALARSEQLAAIGQTAASVAHQVGTPLNLVSGYVQLMLEEPDLDPTDRPPAADGAGADWKSRGRRPPAPRPGAVGGGAHTSLDRRAGQAVVHGGDASARRGARAPRHRCARNAPARARRRDRPGARALESRDQWH